MVPVMALWEWSEPSPPPGYRSIYSVQLGQWLRQDALGWTSEILLAGAWPSNEAAEKARNLPKENAATVVPVPVERRS
jgi:hypothetical protein